MKYIFSEETVVVPENVKVHIRSRIVTVEGPRGKLTKDLSHIAVTFALPEEKNKDGLQTIRIEIHHGSRKNVATLRTVKSIVDNLITGVTKGYKYKMRYVYAHFPINVNIEKGDDGQQMVEIRNFLGEKLVRHVKMAPGVTVEPSKGVKDQIELTGESLENVSQSAADIQQICRVRNKDIRKFLDGLYVSERGHIAEE
ncbi:60S ribosomal protein L9B [Knufia obscura]|uniref:60S ribosomal protein L9B n=2 Tax=Knufia TaxID=430999 RepID=A0AAN8EPV7_9EURO|nr:60S ribosomal protein L9B [Knufia obscura]KAK5956213.1 60S ribosomal protein L9B [Knufia fluminis]